MVAPVKFSINLNEAIEMPLRYTASAIISMTSYSRHGINYTAVKDNV
jgi:hypothetical protein